jgi:ABC-type sugar transport system ATPase subunit
LDEVLRTEQLVRRSFGDPVLNGMDLSLYRNEILGIAGLNGSGRSALTDVLSGLKGYDDGFIYLEDKPVRYHSVLEAQQLGIYCIRHKSTLIEKLTIADNFCILPPRKIGEWRIKKRQDTLFTKTILDELNIPIDFNREVQTLSLAEKHLIEIARAGSADAKVIILDDIMLSYTEKEYWDLYRLLKRIQSLRIALIVIDSKLDRLLQIAGRLIVIRSGRNIGFFYAEEFNELQIQKVLTGTDFVISSVDASPKSGKNLLTATGICNQHLHDISFNIKKGEVVGFVDEGSDNCRAIIDLLNGNAAIEQGQILLDNRELFLHGGKRAMTVQGIGYIGYYKASLFPHLSLAENLTIVGVGQFSGELGINTRMERFVVGEYASKLGIDRHDLNKQVQWVDNRTQINVALYKWMVAKAKIVVMDNTFSGTDITMHNCIYDFISEAKKCKMGIIYTSPYAQEVYKTSDRVYRIRDGCIIGR